MPLVVSSAFGGVAERLNATVLKTVDGQPSVGSNPTPSAKLKERDLGLALLLCDFYRVCVMTSASFHGFSWLDIQPDFVVLNKAPGIGIHDEDEMSGQIWSVRLAANWI
jgi:hypothetical protein